jgi:hypothetical protein
VGRLKEDLSIETTFDPSKILPDSPFKGWLPFKLKKNIREYTVKKELAIDITHDQP